MKKFLSFFCTLLIVVTALAVPASAQECSWDLWVDGVKKTSSYEDGGLKYDRASGTVTLTNYTGKTIEAIPGGDYGDDDAPQLKVVLFGNNTLTGGTLYNGNLGALYAAERGGGSGVDSNITIIGYGKLNINISPSSSTSTTQEITAISCGNKYVQQPSYGSVNGPSVYIKATTYSSEKNITGIKASIASVSGKCVLDIKTNATRYHKLTGRLPSWGSYSNCTDYGVDGALSANITDGGYLSVDTYSPYNNGVDYNVNGDFTISNTTNYYVKCKDSWVTSNYDIDFAKHSKTYLIDDDEFFYTVGIAEDVSMLKNIDRTQIFAAYDYPQHGDDKVYMPQYVALADAGAYYKVETNQIKSPTDTTSVPFEKYGDAYYDFWFDIVPMPGYFKATANASELKYKSAYPITSSLYYDKVIYDYNKPTFTKQPQKYVCSIKNRGSIVDISAETSAKNSDVT
ncbi:MAG: hypothetical protein PUE08_05670 [Eubacteriales bacterium]|nr:hypothetical protein [Eubacteriales bacterium]